MSARPSHSHSTSVNDDLVNLKSTTSTEGVCKNKDYGKNKDHQKGLKAELYIEQLMNKRGWITAAHRFKMIYGEVDFIFLKHSRLVLVEVKSLHDEWMMFERLSPQQKNRLLKNALILQAQTRGQFILDVYAVFVGNKKTIWVNLN